MYFVLRIVFTSGLLLAVSSGCGSRNVQTFGPNVSTDSLGRRITRAEVADQGSGNTYSTGGSVYQLTRTTLGGAYLRRNDGVSPSHGIALGIHGNPTATK